MAKQTALVTGCSEGGIGYYLALALVQAGFRVIGTVRKHGKEGTLSSKGVEIIIMDIDSEESVSAAKEEFLNLSPTLDLLINNAGAGGKEALIEVDMKTIEKRFRTNVFGLLLTCQAFGQIMAKRGSGTIVNVGSVAGIASVPWMGLYGATKAAVRSLSATLAYELGPLGIKVVHLAPALIATPFSAKTEMLNYTGTIYERGSIEASEKATDKMVDTGNGRGMPPDAFAARVLALVLQSSPPAEIVVGTDDWMFKYIQPYLPSFLWRGLINRNCGTGELKAAR